MALTDAKIRGIKPPARQVKHFDGGGLYLLCTPSGGRLWRLKYRFDGKSKGLSLGKYPDVSLLDARQRRDEARRHLANKVDPGDVRRAQREVQSAEIDTFAVISGEWFNKFSSAWSEKYRSIISRRLEIDINPFIGTRPIAAITAPELLAVLRRAEARGCIDTAHRLRSITGLVFRYAVATGRAERDPSGDLRGALPPAQVTHHAALTDPKQVAPLLRAIDGYQGSFIVKSALRLAPLFFVRPGELRHAEWSEIDLDEALWSIPASRMKMRQAHLVPLCSQAVTILTALKALTGAGRYCFPSMRSSSKKPMSDNTLGAALQTLGYTPDVQSAHGFRAMARTILDEVLSIRPDFIEHQLAHSVRDPNGTAYNRTAHLAERRKMMQTWADYLDELKAGAKVLPMQRKV
jgi:integrase